MNNIRQVFFAFSISLLMYGCAPASGDFAGSEYMPDMGHPLAIEANVFDQYSYTSWDDESTIPLWEIVKNPGQPVAGTVPRGYAGGGLNAAADLDVVLGNDRITSIRIQPNGSVPYYYEDTDASRALASAEIIDNPFPITTEGLERGEELFNIYCAICHGEKADGQGFLYNADDNPNAKYLAAPANLTNELFSAASNGQFYHAIMYGKNVMGSHADKLGYEERWQVIHYIRSLQAKTAKASYNEEENTFNSAFGVPGANFALQAENSAMIMELENSLHEEEEHTDGEHHTDGH